MYAIGFVAAAQVVGVDIAPLIAVGRSITKKLKASASPLNDTQQVIHATLPPTQTTHWCNLS
jgi:hypothetical protein